MGKQLIIAEKPSVAQDIARSLGGFTKEKDYFESDEYVLSSAVGHLLVLAVPDEYEVKRGKWSFANLPVLPPRFQLDPVPKTEDRLKLLKRLIKRKDVDGLINACDAGREGELIFHFIAEHSGADKPVRRLWLQSMTKDAIRSGFENLRDASEVAGLRDAAESRAQSDWLIGINGTRAMTAFNSKTGGFHLTTVGRVQTPTLAIIVEREEQIRGFKTRPYWELEADFEIANGGYRGRWFDPSFKKADDEHANAYRLWNEEDAQRIAQRCLGKTASVTEESKPSTQQPAALFDLTTLQREANGRFGFSARNTLAIAQALYERHKVLTYPRTDARALPEDYLDTVPEVMAGLPGEYQEFVREIKKQKWITPNKRIFNNAKISDHFAIIPTGTAPKALSEPEQKIYDLVTRRFLAIFYPPAEFLITTRISRILDDQFRTEGKVLVKAGWLAVFGKEVSAGSDNAEGKNAPLVALGADEKSAGTDDVQIKALQTKPPARYNEASLLSAMEGAGKMVDDEELRAAMAGRGLGTPATRAQIIENLIGETYILREGKELVPTAKAFSLVTLLRGLGIVALTSPEMTGEWEYKLAQMENGGLKREVFMDEIKAVTREIVERAKAFESDTVPGDFIQLKTPCPRCGGTVKENYKKFACQKCDWATWKIVASRQFEYDEIETLLRDKRVGPLLGFRSKMGRAFNAEIKLNDDMQPEFDFGQPQDDGEPVDFSDQQTLGHCPKCQSNVYEQGMQYVCEKSVGTDRQCDFRSGKVILQQPIEREQMEKLLTEGKTSLLTSFVSMRTRRKFSAYLAWDGKVGKVSFEFEAKKPGTGKTTSTKAAAKAEGAAPVKAVVEKKATTKTGAGKKAAALKVEVAVIELVKKPPAKKRVVKKTSAAE